jgi:hypothetical protein
MCKKITWLLVAMSLGLGVALSVQARVPRTNLFDDYGIDCKIPRRPGTRFNITAGVEHAVKARSYQADEDDAGYSSSFRKRGDVLQLYQDEQDFIAALKGEEYTTAYGQLSQKFSWQDDDGTYGWYIPDGKLSVQNAYVAGWFYFPRNLSLAITLPIISMRLHDVTWRKSPRNNNQSFESILAEDLVADVEKFAQINLHDWAIRGIGDLSTIVWWEDYFPQAYSRIRCVGLNARIGCTFPTGKKAQEDDLLTPVLGQDGGVGIVGGFGLDIFTHSWWRFGGDVELLYLLSDTRSRRIKTDPAQTDLLFLQKDWVMKDPGFTQRFKLYLQTQNVWRGLSARLEYLYCRQQEDKYYLSNYHFDPKICNSAESLQDWTTHSVLAELNYDFYSWRGPAAYVPYVSLRYKHGFNGQRAILFDTVSLVFGADF